MQESEADLSCLAAMGKVLLSEDQGKSTVANCWNCSLWLIFWSVLTGSLLVPNMCLLELDAKRLLSQGNIAVQQRLCAAQQDLWIISSPDTDYVLGILVSGFTMMSAAQSPSPL